MNSIVELRNTASDQPKIMNTQYGHSQSEKSEEFVDLKFLKILKTFFGSRISINWNPPFQTSLHKISKAVFFRLTKLFFRNKKILSKEQLLFSFLCIKKQKKNSEWSENFWKFLSFKIYLMVFEKCNAGSFWKHNNLKWRRPNYSRQLAVPIWISIGVLAKFWNNK